MDEIAGTTFEVELTKLIYGGEAMGRLPDGRAVFVPFGVPGETVRLRLVEEKRGYARAELLEVLQPAAGRIEPRCVHFGACGGCHYQHMTYEEQLAAKAEILRDQLERIGGLTDPPVQPTRPSPRPWLYRNHLQFHLTPEGQLGYHAARSQNVIPIEECFLPMEPIGTFWKLLEVEPVPGLQRVHLRVGTDEDIMLALESSDPDPPAFGADLPLSAVHLGPAGATVLSGSESLIITVLDRQFRVSAESFFQVNSPMAGAMVEHLLENLALDMEATALDVYCGVGLFSAFLAPLVQRVIAVESSPSAWLDFEVNLDEFNNVELYQAPAEDVLPALPVEPTVIIVDPPRSGLSRTVVDGILALSPDTLVYVSCDPATLARDARHLTQGGYTLKRITPFDLFPQTYHIESMSFWRK